jgi:hypothetical protein
VVAFPTNMNESAIEPLPPTDADDGDGESKEANDAMLPAGVVTLMLILGVATTTGDVTSATDAAATAAAGVVASLTSTNESANDSLPFPLDNRGASILLLPAILSFPPPLHYTTTKCGG